MSIVYICCFMDHVLCMPYLPIASNAVVNVNVLTELSNEAE